MDGAGADDDKESVEGVGVLYDGDTFGAPGLGLCGRRSGWVGSRAGGGRAG